MTIQSDHRTIPSARPAPEQTGPAPGHDRPPAAPARPPERGEQPTRRVIDPHRPEVRRARRVLLVVIVVAVALQVVAFSTTWLTYGRHYVTTTNAQVDGDPVAINAPVSGVLTGWQATPGTAVGPRQILGRITILDGSAEPRRTIRAPGSGVVAVNNAVNGQYVRQGYQVALAYDYHRLYLTARLDEFDIARVQVDQPVDIIVDAYPNLHLRGIVEALQYSTGAPFDTSPSPDVDPVNPRKVQQYVPVRVAFTSTAGLDLLPGMNATVHIRTDG